MRSPFTSTPASDFPSERLEFTALVAGIISSALYIVMDIVFSLKTPGYDPFSQTISELSAVGAPYRKRWVGVGQIYAVLVMFFGWGVWMARRSNNRFRLTGIFLSVYGFLGLLWPPMHQREVLAAGGGTATDTWHIIFTFITVGCMIPAMIITAPVFSHRFRIYSYASVFILLIFGLLTGLVSGKMQHDEPTPWMGVWERLCIGAFLIWIVVLAISLLQRQQDQPES